MTALAPWEQVDGKVTGRHRDALAVVYIRQSTRQQVLEHGESCGARKVIAAGGAPLEGRSPAAGMLRE